ncbi:Multiple myeloma tumor-associated protein 2 homolog [Linum grandiflorum]
MYHPTRGGVRGGRDQFTWDEVKVDKYRENYLGHSLKAPVGRWQKGKDLHWYTRDKKSGTSEDSLKDEIKRIKEEEEQAMREALGLAPKRSSRPQGNRLDKHEFNELVKRGSTAEDLGAGHADAARVDGLGFSKAPRPWEDPSTLPSSATEVMPELPKVEDRPNPPVENREEDESRDEGNRKEKEKQQEKEKRREKKEKHKKHEKRHSRDSDDKRKHRDDNKERKKRRRHDSDDE